MSKYISELVYYIYNSVFIKPFYNNSNYNNIFNLDTIVQDRDYINYKKSGSLINKTIHYLNSIPALVHYILFRENKQVCNKYFQIYYKNSTKEYDNLETLNSYMLDSTIRYIFIRVNLIENNKYNNHANAIIIDKSQKWILYFEPQCKTRISMDIIKSDLTNYISLTDYKYITPENIGYSIVNKLQRFDNYCQTYVIYAYCIIVNNPTVDYKDYSNMLNSIITKQDSITCFLFHIYKNISLIMDNSEDCLEGSYTEYIEEDSMEGSIVI